MSLYHPDLSAYRVGLEAPLARVRCVGWLDETHPFPRGTTPAATLDRLEAILWTQDDAFNAHANVVRGIDPCPFCGDDIFLRREGRRFPLGMSELWLPDRDGWLAAPSLVLHYMRSHEYRPPAAFLDAIAATDVDRPYSAQDVYDRLIRERSKP